MRQIPLIALIAISLGCEPTGQIKGPEEALGGQPAARAHQAAAPPRDKDTPLPPVAAEVAPPASPRLAEPPQLRDKLEAYFTRHIGRRLYLQTDKPLYRPGETIWARGWDLKASTLEIHAPGAPNLRFALIDPKGAVALEAAAPAMLAQASLELPAGAMGGLYKVRVTAFDGLTETREIVVSAYEPPRIKKKIDFVRKAYGPGDTVSATLELRRPTGEPLAELPLTAMIRLDGVDLPKVTLKTNAVGDALVEIKLPQEIQLGDGLLTVLVKDGGVTESISRRVPIVLRKVQLAFFPEGGGLVEGLESRVYFEAKDGLGKPADVEGVIIDDHGQRVARFSTHHQGLGRMRFTPNSGRTYHAEITRPVGLTERYSLPLPAADGCVLRAYDDLDGQLTPMRISLRCTTPQVVYLVAAQREEVIDLATVEVKAGAEAVVYLDDKGQRMGVTRVTAMDLALNPLAERVIFRHRRAQLQISITPDQPRYTPRAPVALKIETKTPSGQPVAADLAVTVVDDTALSFADDKTGHILSAVLLAPEIPGKVEEPNFYFDLTEEKSALALDLLMGARGWRRFDWAPVLNPAPPPDPFDGMVAEGERFLKRGALRPDGAEEKAGPPRRRPAPPKAKAKLARAEPMMDAVAVAEAPAPQPVKAPKRKEEKRADRAKGEDNKNHVARRQLAQAKAAELEEEASPPAAMGDMAKMDMAEDKPVLMGGLMADEDAFDVGAGGKGRGQKIAREQGVGRVVAVAPVRVFPIPVYKPEHTGPRADFRETIFWSPAVRTDEKGQATVTFPTSDAITSFRAIAEGVGARHVGRQDKVFKSSLPFSMSAKLPLAVSEGDLIELPLTLSNEVDRALPLTLNATFGDGLRVTDSPKGPGEALAPQAREALFYGLKVEALRGEVEIAVQAEAGGLKDQLTRRLSVEPLGFPQEINASGVLVKEETRRLEIADPLKGTLTAEARFYASPTSSLIAGIEGLIREPHGCFEQTSATHYPNVMVMQYLATQKTRDPALVKRINTLLDQGYKRLISFEAKRKGYEWFGRDPGHEALTAYGLLEFSDMRGLYPVDEAMIKRTVAWLKAREDGAGGFKRNKDALDTFGKASPETTNAYVRWAIAEAGLAEDFSAAMEAQAKLATRTQDPYLLALAINTLSRLPQRRPLAKEAAARLLKLQDKEGAWPGARESVTRSGGINLKIETTALAMLALMSVEAGHQEVQEAVKWLRGQRGGFGQWGATQATVLALKAMTVYNIKMTATQAPGAVTLIVNGVEVATQRYEAGAKAPVHFEGFGKYLTAGDNTIQLKREGAGAPLPYSLVVSYRSLTPATAEDGAIGIETHLEREAVSMGESVRLVTTLTNRTQADQPMTLARVGLPGGLAFQNWQLKDLQERGEIAFFETRPREVVIYLDGLKAGEVKAIPLDLEARIPGVYTGPASNGYLYYTPDKRRWAPGLKVKVERG
ncbi:hypothetical protein KKB55_01600 [Myxococcota bacterium]|nr:hypothetical protein [Myxococcota bacterium]